MNRPEAITPDTFQPHAVTRPTGYRAMDQVEARMALAGSTGSTDGNDGPPTGGQLLALVDTLHDGTLNEDQRETVHALRLGILALAEPAAAHCGG